MLTLKKDIKYKENGTPGFRLYAKEESFIGSTITVNHDIKELTVVLHICNETGTYAANLPAGSLIIRQNGINVNGAAEKSDGAFDTYLPEFFPVITDQALKLIDRIKIGAADGSGTDLGEFVK